MKKYLLMILLCPYLVMAQHSLKLTIGQEREPLSFAHYIYGKHHGVADVQGQLRLLWTAGTSLEINHLSAGYQVFDAEVVRQALAEGELNVARGNGYHLQPVTVIALRTNKPQRDLMHIDDAGSVSHDAGAFLLSNPVVSGIRKSGGYGVDPVLRGFKYDQINIVIDDGHSALAACPNRMDPPASQIPMNMMETVEILKGPHALRYGNTTGGTIHFRSNPPVFSDHLAPIARATLGYESNGSILRSELMGGINSRNIQFQLFGALSQGEPYKAGKGETIPSQFYRQSLGMRLSAKPARNQLLQLNAVNNYAKDTDFPSLPMDLRTDNTWMINLRHELNLSGKILKSLHSQLSSSAVDHEMDNLTRQLNPRTMDAVTLANTSFAGLRTEAELRLRNGSMMVGIDLRTENAKGERTRKMLTGPMAGKTFKDNIWQDAVVNRAGFFAEYRQALGAFNFSGAVRLESLMAEAGKPDDKFSQTYSKTAASQFFPSFSAGASRLFGRHWTASLWLSRGMRGAGITERYINFLPIGLDAWEVVGNPVLKPEVNHQADAELQFRSAGFSVRLSLFAALLNDYITQEKSQLTPKFSTSPGVRQFTNIDRASMTGAEGQILINLPASLRAGLQAAIVRGQNLSAEEPLPEIPPMDARIFLRGSYLKGKLNPEISWRSVVSQKRLSEQFGEASTPGFDLVDISLLYEIVKNLNLKLSVTNLLDEQYYEHLSRAIRLTSPPRPLYGPGRSMNVFLSYRVN